MITNNILTSAVIAAIISALFTVSINLYLNRKNFKNDYFKILTSYGLEEYHLVIYNRWGQKIFETNEPKKGWDGTFNGNPASSGSNFIWHCHFKRSGVVSEMKGYVVLIR